MALKDPPAGYQHMTKQEFKTYESRVRRAADRQGYTLVKSMRNDPRGLGHNQYVLVWGDRSNEALMQAARDQLKKGKGSTLQEIEQELGFETKAAA